MQSRLCPSPATHSSCFDLTGSGNFQGHDVLSVAFRVVVTNLDCFVGDTFADTILSTLNHGVVTTRFRLILPCGGIHLCRSGCVKMAGGRLSAMGEL
jgi:hypothetical protein